MRNIYFMQRTNESKIFIVKFSIQKKRSNLLVQFFAEYLPAVLNAAIRTRMNEIATLFTKFHLTHKVTAATLAAFWDD